MVGGAIAGLGVLVLFGVLHTFTDSATPLWDAGVSAFAYSGMWLLARHRVENWIWLNVSNALAIPLYVVKGLPLTAGLTIFYFIVAIFGYFRWLEKWRKQRVLLAKG
jgi:nicotinamide mononucleotide transporter